MSLTCVVYSEEFHLWAPFLKKKSLFWKRIHHKGITCRPFSKQSILGFLIGELSLYPKANRLSCDSWQDLSHLFDNNKLKCTSNCDWQALVFGIVASVCYYSTKNMYIGIGQIVLYMVELQEKLTESTEVTRIDADLLIRKINPKKLDELLSAGNVGCKYVHVYH